MLISNLWVDIGFMNSVITIAITFNMADINLWPSKLEYYVRSIILKQLPAKNKNWYQAAAQLAHFPLPSYNELEQVHASVIKLSFGCFLYSLFNFLKATEWQFNNT